MSVVVVQLRNGYATVTRKPVEQEVHIEDYDRRITAIYKEREVRLVPFDEGEELLPTAY